MARIAIVDLCFNWPPEGGSWVDVKNIAQRLVQHGHKTTLFVSRLDYGFPRGRIAEPLPFPARQIPFSRFSFNLFTAPLRFRGAVHDFKPDFVFITDGYFLKPFLIHALRGYRTIIRFYAYEIFCIQNNRFINGGRCTSNLQDKKSYICKRCRRLNYPLLPGLARLIRNEPQYFVFHEYLMSLAFLPVYPRLLRKFLKEAERLIVYSDTQRELLREYNQNISLIPSGVDTALFEPSSAKPEGIFTIGLAGRYYEEAKGLDIAIRACRKLRAEGLDIQVLVASPGGLDFQDKFVIYSGWYDRNNLPDFYSRCDVILMPSLWDEPFGIAAVEALSCGVPVIASSSGALPKIVEDGKTGFIFPPGDADALADRIRALIKNHELRSNMGLEARKTALSLYDWDVIVKKHYLPLFAN